MNTVITDNDLKDLGSRIIAARRRVWDLERKLGTRPWDTFLKHDLTVARREYTALLKERKAIVAAAQLRFF